MPNHFADYCDTCTLEMPVKEYILNELYFVWCDDCADPDGTLRPNEPLCGDCLHPLNTCNCKEK